MTFAITSSAMLTPIQHGSTVIVPPGFKGQQKVRSSSIALRKFVPASYLFLLFSFFLFASIPSFGARRLTADQFEHLISEIRSRSDAEAAHQIADVELSERLSASRLSTVTAGGSRAENPRTHCCDCSSIVIPRSPAE